MKTDATAYGIDIYRLGYYGGNGARLIATVTPTVTLPQTQPPCLTDAATGLIDCGNWAESASWSRARERRVGCLHRQAARAPTPPAARATSSFVVRNDASHSDLLFQTSDTTWQAYNTYGGNSLYTGGPGRPRPRVQGQLQPPVHDAGHDARGLLLQRRVPDGAVARGQRLRHLVHQRRRHRPLRRVDAANSTRCSCRSVTTSTGPANQRANVEAARDAGVNLAFFSGNEIFWKTRWEPSIDGSATADRTLVSYKETHADAKIDPDPSWTGTWRDPLGSAAYRRRPPRERVERARSSRSTAAPYADPGARRPTATTALLAQHVGCRARRRHATTLRRELARLRVGRGPRQRIPADRADPTCRRRPSNVSGADPPDQGFDLRAGNGDALHHACTAPSGALVFDAGTVQWSWGLDGTHDRGGSTPDSAMQQATVNLFADMGVQPATLQSGLVRRDRVDRHRCADFHDHAPGNGDAVARGTPVTVTGTADRHAVAVGSVGVEVSTDGGTTWHPATGTRTWTLLRSRPRRPAPSRFAAAPPTTA